MKLDLVSYLSDFVTEEKYQLIEDISALRTRHLTVVLENIYQPHNASAVIRSCECFGIQDIHVIEKSNHFRAAGPISLGSDQWVSINRYNHRQEDNTRLCLEKLKQEGYRLAALTLREDSIAINDMDLNQKTALCFGEEMPGLSETAHELADIFVKIPMYGFTQSFNISVTVAISLFALTNKLRKSEIAWTLSEAEQIDLEITWLSQAIRGGDKIIERFLEQYHSS